MGWQLNNYKSPIGVAKEGVLQLKISRSSYPHGTQMHDRVHAAIEFGARRPKPHAAGDFQ
jgi:hypothetical protein